MPTPTGFRIYLLDLTGPVTPATANARGWHLNWQASADNLRRTDLCYDPRGIYVDVNTAACGFTTTPRYITSIGGSYGHWRTTGATSIYQSTATGFRVYIYNDLGTLTPAYANSNGWNITWEAR